MKNLKSKNQFEKLFYFIKDVFIKGNIFFLLKFKKSEEYDPRKHRLIGGVVNIFLFNM